MHGLIQMVGEAQKTYIGPPLLDKAGQRGEEETSNWYRVA